MHPRLPAGLHGVRIGVEIASTPDGRRVLRAVGVRGEHITWRHSTVVPEEQSLASVLTEVLANAPTRRWWVAARVTVALGPSLIQLKRLAGLPLLTNATELAAAVRINAGRFFLRNGVPLATTSVRVNGPGEAWAGAAEQPVLAAAETACRAAGLTLRAIVPTAVVLGEFHRLSVSSDGTNDSNRTIQWPDGGKCFALTFRDSRLIDLQRLDSRKGGSTADITDGAECIGSTAHDQWAGAYGAAAARVPLSPAWPIERRDTRPVSTRRQISAIGALSVAVILAGVAPGLSAWLSARSAASHIRANAMQQRTALAIADSLADVTAALTEASAFAAARRPATIALSELTRALPDSAAITAYYADTVGGTLAAVAPHASALVSQLERDPRITAIQIVGPVTQETVASGAPGGRQMERATIRFRWSDAR